MYSGDFPKQEDGSVDHAYMEEYIFESNTECRRVLLHYIPLYFYIFMSPDACILHIP